MKIEELEAIVDSTKWSFLKKGGFNSVSISRTKLTIGGFTGQWVLKTPLYQDALSKSTRAVRKWNELNPDYPAFKMKDGWLAPYLGDTPASDEQISNKLIDIYRRTRNIVFDAYVDNNFLLYKGEEVICIDVDQSLRRGSIASDNWCHVNSPCFSQHFNEISRPRNKSRVAVIATLFYLEKNLSGDSIQDHYITPSMISKLHIFRHERKPVTVEILDTLLEIITVDPTNEIKDKYLTPLLVETLKNIRTLPKRVTKELLLSLINDQLLMIANPYDIIKRGDLDDVRILIKQDNTLLFQTDKNGFTLLHIAAMYGHTEIVSYLLAEGAHIDAVTPTNSDGSVSNRTALDLAIRRGKDAAANFLLERGATISSTIGDNFRYLFFCARTGLLHCVKSFIKRNPESIHARDNYNQTALLWAAAKGHHEIVEFFITQGADVNIATKFPANYENRKDSNRSALDWAIIGGHILTVSVLNQSGAVANHVHSTINDKSLEKLITDGDLASVRVLINHNRALLNQIDKDGYAPLHYAAFYGQIEIARYLITAGADLNAVTLSEGSSYFNMTAMDIVLSIHKHDLVIILLLEAGAVVSPPLNGNDHPIHIAAKNGKLDIVKRLVKSCRDFINVTDSKNQTPLLWAASRGHDEAVKFLIEQGADVNIATQLPATHSKYHEEHNRSPLDWALKGGHTGTALTLIKAGAVANISTEDSQLKLLTKNLVPLSIFKPSSSSANDAITDEELANWAFGLGSYRV